MTQRSGMVYVKSPLRSLNLALYRYSSKRLAFFRLIALRILEAYSSDEMRSKPGIPASALHPSSEEPRLEDGVGDARGFDRRFDVVSAQDVRAFQDQRHLAG